MKQIFINLPVADVERSMAFYTQIGFASNPLFTDDHQKCMVWSEQIYVMLISQPQFTKWNTKSIPDTKKFTTANFTLPVETVDRMNEMVEKGIKAGGTAPMPLLDEGFMQLRRLEDYDGHVWDFICLDVEEFKKRKGSKSAG